MTVGVEEKFRETQHTLSNESKIDQQQDDDQEMTELAHNAQEKSTCAREREKKQRQRPIRVYLIGAARPINRARRLREKPKSTIHIVKRGPPKCEIDNVSEELWKCMCLSEN